MMFYHTLAKSFAKIYHNNFYYPKIPIVLIFFLWFGSICFSQTKEIKMMEAGEYDKALSSIKKKLENEAENPVYHYLIGKLFITDKYEGFSVYNAYNSTKRAKFYYQQSDSAACIKYHKYNVTKSSIVSLIDSINNIAFNNAKATNSIKAIEVFINKYTDSEERTKEAQRIKESLYFQVAVKENTKEAYLKFMKQFPGSDDYSNAKDRCDELVFLAIKNGNDFRSILDFAQNNPDNTYRDSAIDMVWSKYVELNELENFERFIRSFPKNKHISEAYEYLFEKYNEDGELSSLQAYVHDYPDFATNNEYYADALRDANFAWMLNLSGNEVSDNRKILDKSNAWQTDIKSVEDSEDELKSRIIRENGKSGVVQFSLMWGGYNDIDLICVDPNDEEINYEHKSTESGGVLDIDMNWLYGGSVSEEARSSHNIKSSDKPVENIFWPEGKAPGGTYKVYIRYMRNYAKEIENAIKCNDPVNYVVRVKINDKYRDFKGEVSYDEEKPKKLIFECNYFPVANSNDSIDIAEETIRAELKEYIRRAAPKELAFVALQKAISREINQLKWQQAVDTIKGYSEFFNESAKMKQKVSKLSGLLSAEPAEVIRENLGPEVNTNGSEYYPVLSGNDKTLYFCGKDRDDNLGGEDIFYSRSISMTDGNASDLGWSTARSFNYINTAEGNEAPLSVSADENTILLFYAGDIYYSNKKSNKWSEVKKFPEPVNTTYWEGDAMITGDGNSIVFASNRPGGFNLNVKQGLYHGGYNYASDIYVCSKTDSGWGEAQNLGKIINTRYCERSPFLHPDMSTMFFSSDGHTGIGDLDVFRVKRLSDTSWTQWGKPENLGKMINTTGPDWGYKINTSGKYAYYSYEQPGSEVNEDLYRILLPDNLKPDNVVSLTGTVVDSKGNPVNATVQWENLLEKTSRGTSDTSPENGEFFIIFPANKLYGYYGIKEGYYPVSHNLDLRKLTESKEVRDTIKLFTIAEISEMKSWKLNNVFFDPDKSELKSESYPELNRVADLLRTLMKNKPESIFEIAVHTDDVGESEANKKLSEERAQAIYDYLTFFGIAEMNLKAAGYGESLPVVPGTSTENRRKNRRVEIVFR